MLTYWFPAPVSFWWPLAFAILFAVVAVAAVTLTLIRRPEERDAGAIALFYGLGFGLVAVGEFLVYLDLAFGWSLASLLAISAGLAPYIAIAAAVVAVVAIVTAIVVQVGEERSYHVAIPAH